MPNASSLCAKALAFAVSAILVAASLVAPVRSNPAGAVVEPGVHDSIERAVEHERGRRRNAIAGMAVGGAIVVAGAIASAVADLENRSDWDNGQPAHRNTYVGYAIGLGLGLPIVGISGYIFADAQHKLNRLRQQRVSLDYSPELKAPILNVAFGF